LYVQVYLIELKKYYGTLCLITNEDKTIDHNSLAFLYDHDIKLMLVKNEGYDFGIWYKALQETNVEDFTELALINDSCFLFKNLELYFKWSAKQSFNFLGLVESLELDQLHLQYFFLIFKHQAIRYVKEYFDLKGIVSSYDRVIQEYELGLYTYLLSHGIKGVAQYPSKKYQAGTLNPLYFNFPKLLKDGFPLVKKKMLFHAFNNIEADFLKQRGYPYNSASLFHDIRGSLNTRLGSTLATMYEEYNSKRLL
jgi:hypothetical protein